MRNLQAFSPILLTVLFLMATARAVFPTELLMFEQQGCIYCERWNAELSAVYPKTDEGKFAPLRRIDLYSGSRKGLDLKAPVQFTPTFVVVEKGHELGRIEGYPGEDFFWGLLDRILRDATAFKGS